ncbi:MAG: multiprotein bridging factor aMBF1, partial [Candidatus Hydrothermarchaeales archaeon]
MNCEICGREIIGDVRTVKIEGTLMRACRACARLGERVVGRKEKVQTRATSRIPTPRTARTERVVDVVDDYAKIIRQNREKAGLTQEQLGTKINEKGSVIARLESGHMKPDLKVARKLERLFDIKLFEEIE